MSERRTFQPYNEYQQRQRNLLTNKDEFGPKLFRQMVVGFVCAGLLGLIFLVMGAVFMKDALQSDYAISVMLCVFGMGRDLMSTHCAWSNDLLRKENQSFIILMIFQKKNLCTKFIKYGL
jgi:hypothetical protein